MNITEIKTSKGEFLGVLVPDTSKEFEIDNSDSLISCYQNPPFTDMADYIYLPGGPEYKIIGIQTEITEEQATTIVDQSIHTALFAHYVKGVPVNTYCYNKAIESLNSLMQKLEMYSENPDGLEPKRTDYGPTTNAFYLNHKKRWQQAQSRVGKWLIIQKIK